MPEYAAGVRFCVSCCAMGRSCDDAVNARFSFTLCALLCADRWRCFLCVLFVATVCACAPLLVLDVFLALELVFVVEAVLLDAPFEVVLLLVVFGAVLDVVVVFACCGVASSCDEPARTATGSSKTAGAAVSSLVSPVTVLGQATTISVHVRDRNGVRRAAAFVEQNGARYRVWEDVQPSAQTDSTWTFTAGVKTTPQLQDGKAKLIVEASSNDLLRKTGRWQAEITVVTRPPSVSADSDQHYLYLGMADLATFTVSGTWTEAGVRVGDEKFRGWPMPGGKPGMFSLYAFAWNMPPGTMPVVFASNGAGSDVTSSLVVQFPKKEQPKYTTHDLQVSDAFLQKVVSELDPNGAGDPVERFVRVNSEMRRSNNQTLSDLRLKTADRFLWSRPFIRQAHSQAEASFADVRNYSARKEDRPAGSPRIRFGGYAARRSASLQ